MSAARRLARHCQRTVLRLEPSLLEQASNAGCRRIDLKRKSFHTGGLELRQDRKQNLETHASTPDALTDVKCVNRGRHATCFQRPPERHCQISDGRVSRSNQVNASVWGSLKKRKRGIGNGTGVYGRASRSEIRLDHANKTVQVVLGSQMKRCAHGSVQRRHGAGVCDRQRYRSSTFDRCIGAVICSCGFLEHCALD